MSSRKIIIQGVAYVRSRDAACLVHLNPDYVSSLARGRLIDGKRVRGLWFISVTSLKQFMTEQQRHKAAWRARLAVMRREEQRLAGHPAAFA